MDQDREWMEQPTKSDTTGTSRWNALPSVPWYPVLIAAAFVLNLWVESGVSTLAMARSLGIAVAGTGIIVLLVALVTRRPHMAGVVGLLAFGVLISRGLIYVAGLLSLAVAIPLALMLWGRIRHSPLTWPRLTGALNLFGVLILVVVLAGGVTRGTLTSVVGDLQQGNAELSTAGALPRVERAGPDIYVLLLDGFPRADWLGRLFGGDSSAFIEALTERGFDIAETSTSNYMFTQLTLASMLHMKPVPEIEVLEPVLAGAVAGHPLLRNTINDNPVFDLLRERGYRIVTYGPGYEHVSLRRSDVYLDGGQLNDFEYELLRSTTLESLALALDPAWIAEQKRDRIRSGFAHFQTVTADTNSPTFAFIHLPAPHLPVVFAADGGPAPLPPSGRIFGTRDADLLPLDAYLGQLEYVTRRTIDVVDQALGQRAGGDEPIIVVMSDHGAERRPQVFEGDGNAGHYANFFAAFTPGADGLFPEDASPVNVFPRLFNHYLGTDIREWPDERYPWIASP
jgi:hypothetical protein